MPFAALLMARKRKSLPNIKEASDTICAAGGTPLAVIKDNEVLGIVHLKDMVKEVSKRNLMSSG